jgi:hypothetical protein
VFVCTYVRIYVRTLCVFVCLFVSFFLSFFLYGDSILLFHSAFNMFVLNPKKEVATMAGMMAFQTLSFYCYILSGVSQPAQGTCR